MKLKAPEEALGAESDRVAGERGETLANAARTVQSRVSASLAVALVVGLALSALTVYYARTLAWRSEARRAAQSSSASRAQSEMALPSLGPIGLPPSVMEAPAKARFGASLPSEVPDLPLEETGARLTSPGPSGTRPENERAGGAEPAQSPAEIALARRLSGSVLAHDSPPYVASTTPQSGVGAATSGPSGSYRPDSLGVAHGTSDRQLDGLGALLKSGGMAAASADVLSSERFLLPKGAFIDCTLETAIDSTLPGMTTCVTAADTFSADGKVVLLERGTKLVGETRGQVQQGQARVFVLWTEARTPSGVIVPLDSPGADELGRSGLPGQVERHFWERFGAAMLISLFDGAVQAGVQSLNRSSSTVIYGPSTSTDVLTEVLKSTLQIPPTVIKHNGDRVQVLVARDIDFKAVYELRAASR